MRSPEQKIKEALYLTLNNNITYNGGVVPVYTVVPDSVGSHYIFIAEVNEENADLKDRFMTAGYFVVQIFTAFNTTAGSQLAMLSIANDVLNAIQPTVGAILDLSPNFKNTYLYRENSLGFSEDDKTRKIERKVLRFRFQVEQLN